MPRLARTVFPDVPHHITQRGNRREDVFFTDEDRQLYLEWLLFYSQKHNVDVLAYCLMTNHVHLVLTPHSEDGLQKVLKPLHMRYSQYVNKIKGWRGHLWQGRFFSSPLDDAYTWSTIRYVERNPVQAGMVEQAEKYYWSSAAAHCGLKSDKLLTQLDVMNGVSQETWSEWLALPERQSTADIIRRNVEKGLPCGNDNFISRLELLAKRSLRYKPQGRPVNKG
ncbi:putative transposase [Bathymodiolus japonicus methanotrophic gill symbiont]|uniref:transposase n=1 Tax=Bathymodiolus japonicus methanotrophic gill symbiont TaxID=113269 RepID=UPI001B69A22E|nr:transposase [Bathymodiolus japonicus methanotrophic gill symbiont]GFO71752.1 putative transposase [Bathymodiolus japonicus methanotrophic gill symbiont]